MIVRVGLLLVLLVSAVFGQGYERIKAMLDSVGVPYLADDSKKLCAIPVGDLKYSDDRTIYISPINETGKFFVARLTIVDGDENTHFTKELFQKCLIFNYNTAMIKTQYDPNYNDIDLTFEGWLNISAEQLEEGLGAMLDRADSLAKELKDALGR